MTKAVMNDNIKKDVSERNVIGQDAYDKFVETHIQTNLTNLWSK